jgi:hypothetical protein
MAILKINSKEYEQDALSDERKVQLFYLVSAPVKRSKSLVGQK